MNKNNFDIAIFGNGITAKVMCLIANHCNMRFINIQEKEKKEKQTKDVRSLALSSASKDMLKILGVKIESQQVEKMIVLEGGISNGKIKGKVTFNSKELDDHIAFISEYSLIKKSLDSCLELNNKNSIKEELKSINKTGNFSKVTFTNLSLIHI